MYISFFYSATMNLQTQLNKRKQNCAGNERSLQTFPPERNTDLVRRRGGLLSVPGKLRSSSTTTSSVSSTSTQKQLPKLLLNVNIERSFGPVQVVAKPDNTVSDLMKMAIEIYVKEKRRPLLKEADPKFFALHYSQFSLESLKADEKLKNLGSRNFFLRSNPCISSCSEEANMSFPLIKFMDFLL